MTDRTEVSFGDTPVTGSVTGTFLGAEAAEVSFVGSASWADTSKTASIAETASITLGGVESASFADTASIVLGGIESATFAATAAFTETASIATNAETASLAETALSAETASFVESASFADRTIVATVASSSFTASFVTASDIQGVVESASFAQAALAANSASFADAALAANSASFAAAALSANTASFAQQALAANSASFADNAILAQNATSSISASFGTITGSFLGSDSASTSFFGSASFANAATSASVAQTASVAREALAAPFIVPVPTFLDELKLINVAEPVVEIGQGESGIRFNLADHPFTRLGVTVTVGVASASLGRPRLGLQYSLDGNDPWNFLDGVEGPYVDITGSTSPVRVTGPVVTNVSESLTPTFLRVVSYSGSAVAPFPSPTTLGLFVFLQIVEGSF